MYNYAYKYNLLCNNSIGFELMFNYEFHAFKSKWAIEPTLTHTYVHTGAYAGTAHYLNKRV